MARHVGLDLGGTKVYGAVLDGGEVVAEAKRKTPREGGAVAVVDAMAGVVADLGGLDGVAGVGIGAPGAVDAAAGVIREAPNLAGFGEPVPLAELLRARIGEVPVVLGNDVTAAVLAEHELGAGRGARDWLGIWAGTGVGGGLVLDGAVRRGPTGVAGEIGHTVVDLAGVRVCGCGGRGHLEAYAGRRAMEREARARQAAGERTALVELAGDGPMTSKVFAKALAAGDPVATELLDAAVDALGAAVASAVTLLDVELVVVGGGLADRLGPAFTGRVDAAARARLFPGVVSLRVVPAALADRAGAVGAALLAAGR